ncbi:NAD(P)-dependent oxidoreductase [Rubrobacter indicoceani]|uniref:NAD(P)-dependent oxidoreductase n=1 Tax=Rubrobacter indicoceani TaxID=2051957 RepID=UPI000E5ABD27|nr:SDR family oxidoreductase [Rubrobacter indicoceani]
MRLTIFGATGATGRRLVERAVAEGHEVTAFVRSPSRMRGRHERLSVVVGDVRDAARVEEAVAGRGAVISSLGGGPSNPLHPRRPGRTGGPSSVGTRHIVTAMEKHGVRRFACQSAWGAGESKAALDAPGWAFMKILVPPFLRDEYADKDLQEEIIRESRLDWVIVRPMLLTNGPWTGDYRVGEGLRPGRRPWISRADVAEFLLRQLDDDAFVRRTPAIGY